METVSRVHGASDSGLEPESSIKAACALLRENRANEARTLLDRVLTLDPRDPTALFLKGEALFLSRDIAEALRCYRSAMDLGLDRDGAARDAASSGAIPGDFGWLSAMLLGRFEEAWKIADRTMQWRRDSAQDFRDHPRHLRPVWDGRPIAGRSVVVRCYHGLGDTIQFARYLPMLQSVAAQTTVTLQPELLPLFGMPQAGERYLPLDCDLQETFEAEIEISDLPHIFRTELASIPRNTPYLSAPEAAIERERNRLEPHRGLKVGLVWAAGAWKPERSISLNLLRPLSEIDGIALFSLQRGPQRDQQFEGNAPPLHDRERDSLDIAETAALVSSLDLVISVDTMVAHLAGALGIPVWLLLHHASDWRWLLDTDRSPWYPTMRLFRQPRPDGDWSDVIAAVTAELRRMSRGCNIRR